MPTLLDVAIIAQTAGVKHQSTLADIREGVFFLLLVFLIIDDHQYAI